MKKLIALLLAAMMLAIPVLGLAEAAEEAFNPADFIDWFNESYGWMTVANGHWSTDPIDRITDAELEAIFSMATKQQNAVHWTPWYFVVIKDTEEQQKIIGDYWDKPENCATDGTVTVLCLADQILTMDQGHVTEYSGYYMPTTFAYYDSGLTCGTLGVAAAALGYETHYFGTINGEYAPRDLADGQYQSMSRYINENDIRTWGFSGASFPVSGNCVFVCAIVIGKPASTETVETWGSNHVRPANWKIWDGVVNEEPSPALLSAAPKAEEADPAEETAVEADENSVTVKGFQDGDIIVTLTLDAEGKIETLAIDATSQTEGLGQNAMKDDFIAQFIGKTLPVSAEEIDTIAGATITTEAVIEAVNSFAK
ncbi:MAG: FMN-binding protein [Clostridia bacterium]|nr:FMN-binding protein [Clostridia bacterium]